MEHEHIEVSQADGLFTLRLARPEALNAFNRRMLGEMRDALLDAASDSKCRAVVLTGSGRAFCAGADLRAFAADLAEPADRHLSYKTPTLLHEVLALIMRLEKPVLAAVNGPAVGAGFPLAAACDVIVASEAAYFSVGYLGIGLSPDGSSTFRLPRTLGTHKTLELLYLQERLSAADARSLGFVARVFPESSFEEDASAVARRLCALPTRAAVVGKLLILRSFDDPLELQLQRETDGVMETTRGSDFREGVRAFIEKRPPVFTGQ